MPPNPIHDPMTHVGAMLDQLVRQNQTLISFIDRVVTAQHETTVDLRLYRRTTEKAIEDLEKRFEARFDLIRGEIASVRGEIAELRREMKERFQAVGHRFDELDAKTDRIERITIELRSDMLRLENGVLNAQQSALQANLRIEDRGAGDAPPSTT